jgi:hypothetical protein
MDTKTGEQTQIFSEGFPIGRVLRSDADAKKPVTKVGELVYVVCCFFTFDH